MSQVTTPDDFAEGPSYIFLHFNEETWASLQLFLGFVLDVRKRTNELCCMTFWTTADYVADEDFASGFAAEFPESHHEMRNAGNFVLIPGVLNIPDDLIVNMERPSRLAMDERGFYVTDRLKHGDSVFTSGKVYFDYLEARRKELGLL